MNREKVKLATNVPLSLILQDLGTEARSQFSDGVEYRYMCLVGGSPSIMYLPVDGHLAIRRSGAGVGDEIEILKRQFQNRAVFTVQSYSDAQEPPPPPPAAAAPPQREGVRMLAPQAQRLPVPYVAVAAAPQPQPAAAAQTEGTNTALGKRCMRASIDVLASGEVYAKEQYGKTLEFNEEDVRALMISYLIGAQKGGRA